MPFSSENRLNTISGIWFVSLFALSSMYIAGFPFVARLGLSPLVVAIIFGMIYANTLRSNLPAEWVPGVQFSAKMLLRTAIVLYGFRITFQELAAVGLEAMLIDSIIIITTFSIALFVGIKLLGIDRDTSVLIGSGASICGAAAVLATDSAIKAEHYKASMAVATVVLFGTISMFLYPVLFSSGILGFNANDYGIYAGATVHEVAQAVVAGSGAGQEASNTAVIVKMARVMMLAPFLIVIGMLFAPKSSENEKNKLMIPWFAVGFIGVSGFNSLHLLPKELILIINNLDTFLLAMAMAALGMETNFAKMKAVGPKPFYLALVLFLWLSIGGYYLTKLILGA